MASALVKGVAIVTGCAQGIGKGIALRLAKDGYKIAASDLPRQDSLLQQLKSEIESSGGVCLPVHTDVSQESSVENLVATTVKELGSVDVMVANAAVMGMGSILDYKVEEWDRIFSVNARGTFLCYKHAAKQMVAQGRGGRIVGASATSGKQGKALVTAYGPTKFAIRGLTQGIAQELAGHKITVNAFAAGNIDTPALRHNMEGPDGFGNLAISTGLVKDTQGAYDLLNSFPAIHELGTVEDIAALVSFLVRDEAKYITGQTYSVDGGWAFD